MEAHDSLPSRKEHLEIMLLAAKKLPGRGSTDVDDVLAPVC